ncbi:winged helix-turn-helix domain-containing protein [Spongiactinospora sp. TRM90649]|uniref:ArsR/SmtB family transcription factor n=1 Tax=Spongiactinospora sp. TRM90649 TaxID=3031114 RepID=UPI0023F7B0A5|nr:winged helix-turn-helix domain-containing protein [Spongiactinospora sp. TRM90649]MDF5758359.1 winged helix-turn-helix domain-containing protein [Spongiactinospora sp. TRM90649]
MDAEPFAKDADIATVAGLMADPTRAAMLTTLLDGRALAAGELARVAGVSPQTASAHLGRLLDGGLVAVVSQGRHRYYRLAGPPVAEALEVLARISPRPAVRSLKAARQARLLREARTCYDHLAGQAGVELLDRLIAAGCLAAGDDGYEVPEKGEAVLRGLGVEVGEVRRTRRRFAPECLDWTERRPHLGGALGAALTGRLIECGWFERGRMRRALRVTEEGRLGLKALM